jgi:hypothetical protein
MIDKQTVLYLAELYNTLDGLKKSTFIKSVNYNTNIFGDNNGTELKVPPSINEDLRNVLISLIMQKINEYELELKKQSLNGSFKKQEKQEEVTT